MPELPHQSCKHEDFAADVKVGRFSEHEGGDIDSFLAEVTVTCTECGERFGFRSVLGGLSWREPRCSVDALTLFVPLMSPAEIALAGPLPALDRGPMVFEVSP